MTNTLTTNIKETINQINSLEEAGADIVRISCLMKILPKLLEEIKKRSKNSDSS